MARERTRGPAKKKISPGGRQRLSWEARHGQLMEAAWRLLREEGSDALTLPRLSEVAAVTKPVVYDHFPTRSALLAALYRAYDARQNALMDAAIAASKPEAAARAEVIAKAYVACVLEQGREIPGIAAALSATPELAAIKREYETAFMEKCRAALAPITGGRKAAQIAPARLWAMLGAAETLSGAAARGDIAAREAERELAAIIRGMVERG